MSCVICQRSRVLLLIAIFLLVLDRIANFPGQVQVNRLIPENMTWPSALVPFLVISIAWSSFLILP